jgi:excisionase family DNA binding protein
MTDWLSTKQVAEKVGHHLVTVQRAAESGELHGHQPRRNCSWRFSAEAVDAWIRGMDGPTACGCQNLRLLQRRRAS